MSWDRPEWDDVGAVSKGDSGRRETVGVFALPGRHDLAGDPCVCVSVDSEIEWECVSVDLTIDEAHQLIDLLRRAVVVAVADNQPS